MPHSNESVLTQKEPVKYTNKKDNRYKTTKTTKKVQKIRVVNQKSLILANITMNDKRGQERKGDV